MTGRGRGGGGGAGGVSTRSSSSTTGRTRSASRGRNSDKNAGGAATEARREQQQKQKPQTASSSRGRPRKQQPPARSPSPRTRSASRGKNSDNDKNAGGATTVVAAAAGTASRSVSRSSSRNKNKESPVVNKEEENEEMMGRRKKKKQPQEEDEEEQPQHESSSAPIIARRKRPEPPTPAKKKHEPPKKQKQPLTAKKTSKRTVQQASEEEEEEEEEEEVVAATTSRRRGKEKQEKCKKPPPQVTASSSSESVTSSTSSSSSRRQQQQKPQTSSRVRPQQQQQPTRSSSPPPSSILLPPSHMFPSISDSHLSYSEKLSDLRAEVTRIFGLVLNDVQRDKDASGTLPSYESVERVYEYYEDYHRKLSGQQKSKKTHNSNDTTTVEASSSVASSSADFARRYKSMCVQVLWDFGGVVWRHNNSLNQFSKNVTRFLAVCFLHLGWRENEKVRAGGGGGDKPSSRKRFRRTKRNNNKHGSSSSSSKVLGCDLLFDTMRWQKTRGVMPAAYSVVKLFQKYNCDIIPTIRLRQLELLDLLVGRATDVDNDHFLNYVYTTAGNGLLIRLKDKHSSCRVLTMAILAKIVHFKKQEIMAELKYYTRYDPAVEVRRLGTVLISNKTEMRARFFYDQAFDSNSNVRLEAFKALCKTIVEEVVVEEGEAEEHAAPANNEGGEEEEDDNNQEQRGGSSNQRKEVTLVREMKQLSSKRICMLLIWGMQHCDSKVADVVTRELLPSWLDMSCSNNIHQFLANLDAYDNLKVAIRILNLMFKGGRERTRFVEDKLDLGFVKEIKEQILEKAYRNVTIENMVAWLCLIVASSEIESIRGRVVPGPDELVNLVQCFHDCIILENKEAKRENRDEDISPIMCLVILLAIATHVTWEEANRSEFCKIIGLIFLDPVLDEKILVLQAMHTLHKVVDETRFEDLMNDVFQEIFDPESEYVLKFQEEARGGWKSAGGGAGGAGGTGGGGSGPGSDGAASGGGPVLPSVVGGGGGGGGSTDDDQMSGVSSEPPLLGSSASGGGSSGNAGGEVPMEVDVPAGEQQVLQSPPPPQPPQQQEQEREVPPQPVALTAYQLTKLREKICDVAMKRIRLDKERQNLLKEKKFIATIPLNNKIVQAMSEEQQLREELAKQEEIARRPPPPPLPPPQTPPVAATPDLPQQTEQQQPPPPPTTPPPQEVQPVEDEENDFLETSGGGGLPSPRTIGLLRDMSTSQRDMALVNIMRSRQPSSSVDHQDDNNGRGSNNGNVIKGMISSVEEGLIKALVMVNSYMDLKPCVTSFVRNLYNNYIPVFMTESDDEVRKNVLQLLTRVALAERRQLFPVTFILFKIMTGMVAEVRDEIKLTAYTGFVDLLMGYTWADFVLSAPGNRPESGREENVEAEYTQLLQSFYQNPDITAETATLSDVREMFLRRLLDFSNHHESGNHGGKVISPDAAEAAKNSLVSSIKCQGLLRLFVAGRIRDTTELSQILLLWVNLDYAGSVILQDLESVLRVFGSFHLWWGDEDFRDKSFSDIVDEELDGENVGELVEVDPPVTGDDDNEENNNNNESNLGNTTALEKFKPNLPLRILGVALIKSVVTLCSDKRRLVSDQEVQDRLIVFLNYVLEFLDIKDQTLMRTMVVHLLDHVQMSVTRSWNPLLVRCASRIPITSRLSAIRVVEKMDELYYTMRDNPITQSIGSLKKELKNFGKKLERVFTSDILMLRDGRLLGRYRPSVSFHSHDEEEDEEEEEDNSAQSEDNDNEVPDVTHFNSSGDDDDDNDEGE